MADACTRGSFEGSEDMAYNKSFVDSLRWALLELKTSKLSAILERVELSVLDDENKAI